MISIKKNLQFNKPKTLYSKKKENLMNKKDVKSKRNNKVI